MLDILQNEFQMLIMRCEQQGWWESFLFLAARRKRERIFMVVNKFVTWCLIPMRFTFIWNLWNMNNLFIWFVNKFMLTYSLSLLQHKILCSYCITSHRKHTHPFLLNNLLRKHRRRTRKMAEYILLSVVTSLLDTILIWHLQQIAAMWPLLCIVLQVEKTCITIELHGYQVKLKCCT